MRGTVVMNGDNYRTKNKEKRIEEKVRDIQKILVIDDRIPMSAAREINENLKILLMYNQEK